MAGYEGGLFEGCTLRQFVKVGRVHDVGRQSPAGVPSDPISTFSGLPNLKEKDAMKIKLGNETMYQSVEVIKLCSQLGIPCTLENPISSMLFSAPPLRKCMEKRNCSCVNFDQCGFGTPWGKRTKIVGWNTGVMGQLDRQCLGKQGVCGFSGKPHIVLTGCNNDHVLWTSLAQEYPVKLCNQIADVLISASKDIETHNRLHLSGL